MAIIKAGDTVVNGSGVYTVFSDRATGKLRLVSLSEGFIYEYGDRFAKEYIGSRVDRQTSFNLCELLKKINL